MKTDRIQLRLDAGLKRQAAQVARRRHMTLSSLLVQLLQQVVEADKVERSRQPGGDVEQV